MRESVKATNVLRLFGIGLGGQINLKLHDDGNCDSFVFTVPMTSLFLAFLVHWLTSFKPHGFVMLSQYLTAFIIFNKLAHQHIINTLQILKL